jgi:hypothetical protein
MPFEQLIIFSTNLEPRALVDEAFLRRIPYKIEISDPTEEEFFALFELCAKQLGCEHRPDVIRRLLDEHYRAAGRPLRRCHPRDLLKHISSYCRYKRVPFEVTADHIDQAARVYFCELSAEPDGLPRDRSRSSPIPE